MVEPCDCTVRNTVGTRKSPEQKGVCRFLHVQQNIYKCHHFGGLGSEDTYRFLHV